MRVSLSRRTVGAATLGLAALPFLLWQPVAPGYAQSGLSSQTQEQADAKSAGCVSCHTQTDAKSMHASPSVRLGCTDCHGGRSDVKASGAPGSGSYRSAMQKAHVSPRNGGLFGSAANPERSYTALLDEDLDFVRFMNPGDLRAAPVACGSCHANEVRNVSKSPMTHGAMLYGAALYNNGVLPGKDPIVGESYGPDGKPRLMRTLPAPTADQTRDKGVLPALVPLPRWELSQAGNPFRVFERGGRRRLEVGLPNREEEPGRPDKGLSERGPGTFNRTDPTVLGAQKTRLLDPMLSFLGTNDHPGDYRSSGCTACHVVYANDRSRSNSGPYGVHGNRGFTQTVDPTIKKDESGHPLKHVFTRAIPSSQCISCHMHPGTNMVTTYLGYTWWDNEVDGQLMYPKEPKKLSAGARDKLERANPEGASLRGLWSDPKFLDEVATLNTKAKNTQFADFHGHGWVYRAVFSKDRKGTLLDAQGKTIADNDPEKFRKAVHMKDIHLERGMHCVDCHFKQDSHGDGKLYGEPRAAIEIDCVDCHGTVSAAATLVTSGPAATGTDLTGLSTPWGEPRFTSRRGAITQRSMVTEGLSWAVPQVVDTVTPGNPKYNAKSHYAKTVQVGGSSWGDAGAAGKLAHANEKMTCYACHSAWTTSCFGCHLSQRANVKKPQLHNEGGDSRNWISYNFQTLRDDIYFLAKDGTVTKNRTAPARSACAILVSSQNQNREWIYSQQQTVSSAGFSGTAFSTYVPHTVRSRETQSCTSCHVSKEGDNNAWMAQLLMQGTGLVNFIGRYAYVGEEHHGFEAVVVTEREEPQAVIGSKLHELAYPKEYKAHESSGGRLKEAYHHGGNVLSLQLRGEYLFAAQGKEGLRVYDVAQIDQKGFSERIVSAPVSPIGQKLYVDTRDATSVALPTTMTMDTEREVKPENQEQQRHPLYGYAFVTDREEGLVIVGPLNTLVDGNPSNNFIKRAGSWNEGGALNGATAMAIAGTVGYVTTPAGLVILDLDDPVRPKLLAKVDGLKEPHAVAVQFRYAFVLDAEGLKVVDVTVPRTPRLVTGAVVPFGKAHNLYLARTYAYVAAGAQGLAIVDIERPEKPRLDQTFDGGGAINDAHDVKVGMTNGSAFAYVADGGNGLRVVQVISANDTPGAYGFSPRPTPRLVATYKTHGPAVALSRGLDRDRAVDETGHQLAVFGRRGARPLSGDEQRRMYLRDGKLVTVSDDVPAAGRTRTR